MPNRAGQQNGIGRNTNQDRSENSGELSQLRAICYMSVESMVSYMYNLEQEALNTQGRDAVPRGEPNFFHSHAAHEIKEQWKVITAMLEELQHFVLSNDPGCPSIQDMIRIRVISIKEKLEQVSEDAGEVIKSSIKEE
ncbi:hypothetical protein ACOME3_008602 [Neoechinorhynchus agilis]